MVAAGKGALNVGKPMAAACPPIEVPIPEGTRPSSSAIALCADPGALPCQSSTSGRWPACSRSTRHSPRRIAPRFGLPKEYVSHPVGGYPLEELPPMSEGLQTFHGARPLMPR